MPKSTAHDIHKNLKIWCTGTEARIGEKSNLKMHIIVRGDNLFPSENTVQYSIFFQKLYKSSFSRWNGQVSVNKGRVQT